LKNREHITDSEWRIMGVIWSKVPSTSKYVIDKLRDSTGWSPTTIITFLGRLVKKKVISFEAKERVFYYYPLLTEEECIKKEMQLLIAKVYGGTLNKETLHFLFYGSYIEDYIESLAATLEAAYEKVATHMNFPLTEKITVYIYSNLQRLHSALGVLSGPEWLRAGCRWGILHIASSEYFTEIPAERVAVHELAEIIIHKINPSPPYWLRQGIAAYEGEWLDKNWIQSIIADKAAKNELPPSLTTLSSDYKAFGDNFGYVYAYTIVEFIVEEYGYDKLGMLLREPGNFRDIFKFSEDEFCTEWLNFLNERYITEY
jgi:predicted transcriptional regulator